MLNVKKFNIFAVNAQNTRIKYAKMASYFSNQNTKKSRYIIAEN